MPIASRRSGAGRVSITVSICPEIPTVEMCKFLVSMRRMVIGISAVETIAAVVTSSASHRIGPPSAQSMAQAGIVYISIVSGGCGCCRGHRNRCGSDYTCCSRPGHHHHNCAFRIPITSVSGRAKPADFCAVESGVCGARFHRVFGTRLEREESWVDIPVKRRWQRHIPSRPRRRVTPGFRPYRRR
jgi:hypothetical protein